MKTIKTILVLVLILVTQYTFANQPEEKTTTAKYNGNSYIIRTTDLSYSIINKKYKNLNNGTYTASRQYPGESMGQYRARAEKTFRNRADSIVFSVFTPEEISLIKKYHGIDISYSFDVKTSNYVGVDFITDLKLKDILTPEKVYQIEQKLKDAHLNAGPQNLEKPNKKYFAL